jgi:hypothetical protein
VVELAADVTFEPPDPTRLARCPDGPMPFTSNADALIVNVG